MRIHILSLLFIAPLVCATELSLKLHQSLLNSAFKFENQTLHTPINQYLEGILTQGHAVTTAKASTSPYPSHSYWTILSLVDSFTDTRTHSKTYPTPKILVEFDGTIQSYGKTQKAIFFDERGFQSTAASSQVSSQIVFSNLETSSWGLFWRLKSKLAYRRAYQELMQRKAENEASASRTIALQLNREVDSQVEKILVPINREYITNIYSPYFVAGDLKGHLNYSTDSEQFTITHKDNAGAPAIKVNPLTPISLKLSDDVLSALGSKLFDKKNVNGVEAIQLFLPSLSLTKLPPELNLQALKEMTMSANDEKSIRLVFLKNQLQVELKLKSLKSQSTEVRDFTARITARLIEENGQKLLDTEQPIQAFDAKGNPLPAPELKFVATTLRELFPAVVIELGSSTVRFASLNLKLQELLVEPSLLSVSIGVAKSRTSP